MLPTHGSDRGLERPAAAGKVCDKGLGVGLDEVSCGVDVPAGVSAGVHQQDRHGQRTWQGPAGVGIMYTALSTVAGPEGGWRSLCCDGFPPP